MKSSLRHRGFRIKCRDSDAMSQSISATRTSSQSQFANPLNQVARASSCHVAARGNWILCHPTLCKTRTPSDTTSVRSRIANLKANVVSQQIEKKKHQQPWECRNVFAMAGREKNVSAPALHLCSFADECPTALIQQLKCFAKRLAECLGQKKKMFL